MQKLVTLIGAMLLLAATRSSPTSLQPSSSWNASRGF
jgi:hypothetical protein